MTDKRRGDVLPTSLPPLAVDRGQAAALCAISPSLFDEMVKDRRMPRPRVINSRRVWLVREIDKALNALPSTAGHIENEWDEVLHVA